MIPLNLLMINFNLILEAKLINLDQFLMVIIIIIVVVISIIIIIYFFIIIIITISD